MYLIDGIGIGSHLNCEKAEFSDLFSGLILG